MNKFKINILGRILFLTFSTVIMSFIAFSLVSIFYMKDINEKSILTGKKTGDLVSHRVEDNTVNQALNRLSELALEKSKRIEQGMNNIKNDSKSLASQMQEILKYSYKYKLRTIPNHIDKPIYSGEAYIHYSPEVMKKGITPELKNEVGLSSNIADFLKIKASFNKGQETSVFIGSKNGYLICIDTLKDEKNTVTFTKEFCESYDPRERIWYKEAAKANETKFTDPYKSADGFLAITCASPYYDAGGVLAGVAAVGASLKSLYQLVNDDKYDDTNINFILNKKGEVILSSVDSGIFAVAEEPRDLRKVSELSLANEIEKMVSSEIGSDTALVSVDGKEYYLAYSSMPTIGWYYGTLKEREKIIGPVNNLRTNITEKFDVFVIKLQNFYSHYIWLILSSLIILILFLFWISVTFSKKLVNPIIELTNSVKEIAKGNLDKKLDIKTNDEIELLADSVNNMTYELKEYMHNFSNATVEKERIATELNVARHIQAGMLPNVDSNFSNKKEFDLAASMNPAKEVGGDFYDFYMVDENHLAITVADVSGKGVGAALFMVISKTILKDLTMITSFTNSKDQKCDLASIMEQANKYLYENNKERMFVTVFYGLLDLRTGEFNYVNAGHNPPLVRHKADNEFSYVRNAKKNCIIGVSKKANYQEHQLVLSPGDMLFIYTDGITEAMNEQHELFNESRLKKALDTISEDIKADKMISTVFDAVKDHVGGAEQSDDMTLLGLVFKQNMVSGE